MIDGFPLIDENLAPPVGYQTGYESRDYSAYPIGGLKCAKRYSGDVYDPSVYEARIAQKTAEKSWVSDFCDAVGLGPKNQKNSNYCWIHSVVKGMEVNYVQSGQKPIILSAFYGGAIIKGGRNQGGSGITAVEWLAENGTCREDLHPPMDFSTRNSEAAIANAKLHKILEYDEFEPDDHKSIISSVLNNIPVTVGVPAWGHEILITFLRFDKSATWNYGVLYGIDNSWGDWGTNGRGILSRSYSRFDEAGAIRATTPANE